jgi:type I restriction-modification system DNA methylase subunit
MPDKLFFNTGIPVSLWFVSKDRRGDGHRKRSGEVPFIDARRLGTLTTRRLREPNDEDIAKIAGAYHRWRNRDAYMERRRAEGLSKKYVLRCLKRFIAREVYHDLRADLTAATPGRTPMPMSG